MKILFYVVNGEGLGHLNRSIIIANMLKKKYPKAEIAFMTNSKFNYWLDKKGYSYYSLKNINSFVEINHIITEFKPHAVIWDSSYNILSLANSMAFSIKHIFILRKYKNNILSKFLKSPDFNHFDLVLFPHTKEEFKDYNLPKEITKKIEEQKKIHFVGPSIRETNQESLEKYNLKKDQINIIAIAGGGGDIKSKEYFDMLLKTKQNLEKSNIRIIIITGPYFNSDIRDNDIIKFEPNLLELMQKADLIISQAGYNTINEIIHTKIPSLLYPTDKVDDDQFERVNWLVEKGVAINIENYDEKKLTELLSNIKNKLKELKNKYSNFNLNFNSNKIIDLIYKILESPLKVGVSDKCNNRCSFCKDIGKRGVWPRKEFIKEYLEWKDPRNEVILTGGEPTLRENLDILIIYAKELGYKKITIESNGRTFSYNEYCQKLIEAGANKFIINLFGKTAKEHDKITKVKGSFEQAVEGIKNLRELNQKVGVRLFDGKNKFIFYDILIGD